MRYAPTITRTPEAPVRRVARLTTTPVADTSRTDRWDCSGVGPDGYRRTRTPADYARKEG